MWLFARWDDEMVEVLKKIIDDLDDDEVESVNILSFFDNDREKELYEKWVKIYHSVTPFNIKEGLKHINKSFELSNDEEIMLVSYIKFFEGRLMELKGDIDLRTEKFESEDNGGGMFA